MSSHKTDMLPSSRNSNKIFRIIFCVIPLPFFLFSSLLSCRQKHEARPSKEIILQDSIKTPVVETDTIIVDSRYTFDEAIAGSNAPKNIISELVLFNVEYLSTDRRIHRGQILANQQIESDLCKIFAYMLKEEFVVEKVIPVVRYDWDDMKSMEDNNSYSFCYRNISYSKHAKGMAIDINPKFNPLIYRHKKYSNVPKGAVWDTTVNGTFYCDHFIVKEFIKRGFRWGGTFRKYSDNHHFEKH